MANTSADGLQSDAAFFLRDLWADHQARYYPVAVYGEAVVKEFHAAFFCGALAAIEGAQLAARHAPVVRDELLQKWRGECWQAARDSEGITPH